MRRADRQMPETVGTRLLKRRDDFAELDLFAMHEAR